MNSLKSVTKTLLFFYFAICTAIGFFVLYPGFALTLSNPEWYRYGHQLRRIWGRWLFLCGGIRVKQIEEQPIDTGRNYVIAPNHTSFLDIPTLAVRLPLFINFMAKIELASIPVFGIFFRTIDIAVDRKNVRQSVWAFHEAKEQLLQKHQSIVIFPEGTILPAAPKLGRFKEGAFRLAIETQMPVLPITIIGNWLLLPDKGKLHFRPGKVIQYVHAPIETRGMTLDDVDALKQKVFGIIEHKLAEYGH